MLVVNIADAPARLYKPGAAAVKGLLVRAHTFQHFVCNQRLLNVVCAAGVVVTVTVGVQRAVSKDLNSSNGAAIPDGWARLLEDGVTAMVDSAVAERLVKEKNLQVHAQGAVKVPGLPAAVAVRYLIMSGVLELNDWNTGQQTEVAKTLARVRRSPPTCR